ncbi:hypothetical protein M413DRAFT_449017 [Hebeloma cylindrosporum]|uniref:F-box domain-containing protein n=1 Tax=Hebeloma cylindrosporum TaxID=76867 RepID=A0A0C2XFH0_HEBCY|nr:hypothetical protein M413DRAFT_449017 [Hebeloma cylindrosporum h7]
MVIPHPQRPSDTADGSEVVPLPTEIYESILDELSDSPKTLCACALVCHLFAQRAQQLLFSSICLKRPTKVYKPDLGIRSYVWPSMRFLQIISSSPHLAGYVKSLIVSDQDDLRKYYREELSWIRSDKAVHQILPRLDNLKELGLKGNIRGGRLNCRKWGDSLRAGILGRCSSESLVAINLVHVRNVPLSFLSLAPRLEKLELQSVLFVPEFNHSTAGEVFDLQKVEGRSPTVRLQHLAVTWSSSDEWHTFYPWLVSLQSLTHIKTLDLHVNFEDCLDEEAIQGGMQAISNLLRRCSGTVETLRLLIPEYTRMANSPSQALPFQLDILAMPALRILDLHCCIWSRRQCQAVSVSGTLSAPSAGRLPETALRTLSSIISQTLPLETCAGERDSIAPRQRLDRLELTLLMDDFEEDTTPEFESIGWEEFITITGALAGVGRLESEQEAMERDSRSLEEREGLVEKGFVRRPGATSVTVTTIIPGTTDGYLEGLMAEKLQRLEQKGVECI